MTDQERELIENLLQRIRTAPPPRIDRDAEELIRRGLDPNPDALYILVQSVLVQEMALNRANARIEELRRQTPQGSFLEEGAYRPRSAQEPPRSRFSDFLHNAAQTAAGVVAGEVAFSALSSLFGQHGAYGVGYGVYEGGSGFLGGGGGETIVNNYYEGHGEHPLEHGLSPDLEDRRFAAADDVSSDNATDPGEDTFLDDSSYDDGSDV